MRIALPYGHGNINADIPDAHPVDVIEGGNPSPISDSSKEVNTALNHLLGGLIWDDFKNIKSVAIAINDKTRPVPNEELLKPLIGQLKKLGIQDAAIQIFIAVGTHQPMREDEFSQILPLDISQRFVVVSHDSEDIENLINLGTTSRGTPVWVNRAFYQCDLKIVIGNIEPHQFAGFSGGVKTAAIGLAGIDTVNKNHSLLIHPGAQLGNYFSNPVRQDIEEIGEMIGINMAINAILNRDRAIIKVLAGDCREVMLQGLPYARESCQVPVSQLYGAVIVSPGGYPKDINIYQAQKSLAHAMLVVRPGGWVILAAACPEGSGSQHYEEWVRHKDSNDSVIRSFSEEGFRVGPHKAFLLARDSSQVHLLLVSDIDEALSKSLLIKKVSNLQTAVNMVLSEISENDTIAIMPHASTTIPVLS